MYYLDGKAELPAESMPGQTMPAVMVSPPVEHHVISPYPYGGAYEWEWEQRRWGPIYELDGSGVMATGSGGAGQKAS